MAEAAVKTHFNNNHVKKNHVSARKTNQLKPTFSIPIDVWPLNTVFKTTSLRKCSFFKYILKVLLSDETNFKHHTLKVGNLYLWIYRFEASICCWKLSSFSFAWNGQVGRFFSLVCHYIEPSVSGQSLSKLSCPNDHREPCTLHPHCMSDPARS